MGNGRDSRGVAAVSRRLQGRLRDEIRSDVPLSSLTSFRIGGPADLLVVPKAQEELVLVSQVILEEGCDFLVLGRGTNVLVSDAGFRGVVLLLSRGLKRTSIKYEGIVYVESGCELNRLITWCMEHGLGGLEELSGIPGTVGGAVRMNAGALGRSMGERVVELKVLDLSGEEVRDGTLKARDAGFGYRVSTGIGEKEIITEVKLELYVEDKERIRSRREEFLAWRRERQPLENPSAGSVFLNPPGISAGELIERCGLKGKRVGDAVVSPKHANFIINAGRATADDVFRLMQMVKEEVYRQEGVELREEIKLVGFEKEA